KVSVISIPEPCNNQTIDERPQAESPFTLDSTPTYVDESDCGVTHDAYQCQPVTEVYDYGQNSCYDSNPIGFDHSQPQQYTVNHHIFNAHHDLLGSQKKLNMTLTKVTEQMTQLTSICEMACQLVQKKQEEKQIEEEQVAKAQTWKLSVCYDDDDDEEGYNSLNDNTISELPPCVAITPNEPVDSLSMGDEHVDTIPATESDEFIKSCVENLVPNPNQHSFNAESDLIRSMPNHDSSIIISSKIDSLFDEFAGELTLFKSIPPGINETDCHPEEEIRLTKRLLYDNSSPRLPE
nr:hypothetical protein [Tanacetum cinerariifolium]